MWVQQDIADRVATELVCADTFGGLLAWLMARAGEVSVAIGGGRDPYDALGQLGGLVQGWMEDIQRDRAR